MSISVAHSAKTSPEEAVREISEHIGKEPKKLVVYFASSAYDQAATGSAFHTAFPGAPLIGCSTSGEIVSGKMMKSSMVAMGFDSDTLEDVSIQVMDGISEKTDVETAFSGFENHFGQPMAELDFSKYVGIILIDGLRGAEERVMDRIGDLTNVPFIGGSAGDDLKFATTYVHADGRISTDAAVLAVLKPKAGYDILKTQSFKVLDKKLTVTKADAASRKVIEFGGKPATKAYAEVLGIAPEDADQYFMRHPVGLMAGDEPFVRSPQRKDGESICFYCNILEGMELSLLESLDIVADTRKALDQKIAEHGKLSGVLNFHCILRTLELEAKGQTEAYGQVFSDVPTIGFSTYGEEYIGHINQTSTMLLFI